MPVFWFIAPRRPIKSAAPVAIIVQAGASPAELHIASELQADLSAITGREIAGPMQSNHPPVGSIIVGPGPLAKQFFPGSGVSRLGSEDGLQLFRNGRLLLAGGRPRGTIYAVCRWLQEHAGVRWWTPDATTIPKNPGFVLRQVNNVEHPAFEYRAAHWYGAFDPEFAMHNGLNSQFSNLDGEHGGAVAYKLFVHTYNTLVPPDPYFKLHPEWFSEINGIRTADNAQLCTTNPQLRDFMVKQVLKQLAAAPNTDIISVSQNDNFNYCRCPVCSALDAQEGTHAAGILELANYVAARIKDRYPNVAIDTLAYQFSRKPPKDIRPLPNVIVRLCSIECGFSKPLDDASNASFMQDLHGWNQLTNRLYVWDYVTDFAHYLLPFPNYAVLGKNLRIMSRNGVKGVFEEGGYQTFAGDLSEMKCWMLAQLLWNPFQNDRKLEIEFLKGYYGPAWKPILAYADLMQRSASKGRMGIDDGPQGAYLSLGNMLKAKALWDDAAQQAAGNPDIVRRVRMGSLSPNYVWLCNWDAFKKEARKRNLTWPFTVSKRDFARQWLESCAIEDYKGQPVVTRINEGGTTPQEFVASLTATKRL